MFRHAIFGTLFLLASSQTYAFKVANYTDYRIDLKVQYDGWFFLATYPPPSGEL